MNKVTILAVLAVLASPVFAQPVQPFVSLGPALVQQAANNTAAKNTAAKQAAAQKTEQAKQAEEAARQALVKQVANQVKENTQGSLCTDANGCPALKLQGKEYRMLRSGGSESESAKVTRNEYGADGRRIAVQEIVARQGQNPMEFAQSFGMGKQSNEWPEFRDEFNPKDIVRANRNYRDDTDELTGYNVYRIQQINDSTARVTQIHENLYGKENMSDVAAGKAMEKDTQAIRQTNIPVKEGKYQNSMAYDQYLNPHWK